jgi:hypothetical protein
MNATLLTMLVAFGAAVVYLTTVKTKKNENFNIPSRTWKVEKVLSNDDVFYQNPNYQSILPPRFANTDFGTNIRASLPPYQAMAVPSDPLNKEISIDTTSSSDGGEMTNPIVYDRYLFANRNSKLRSQGDKFRGDLPIIPQSGNWFTPNVHPNLDLEPGCMNVMGGPDNETGRQLAALIYESSGKADTTIAGIDVSQHHNTMARQTFQHLSNRGDVTITSFP